MKKIVLLALTTLFSMAIYAQTGDRILVAVPEFSTATNVKNTNLITKKIMEVVQETKRFVLLDMTDTAAVNRAISAQKTEIFMDAANTVESDLKVTDNTLIGNIINVTVTKIPNSDGTVRGYKAQVTVSLAIKNHTTQATMAEETFTSPLTPLYTTVNKSIEGAIESLSFHIRYFFTKAFPIQCRIIQIISESGKGVKEVRLRGGSAFGIDKKDKMGIYHDYVVDGLTVSDQLGELKITEVTDANTSIAVITKGGDKVLGFKDNLKTISCRYLNK